ncbi:MAG: hypothetical protein KTR16_15385 [Acidiferrobacterales bacterium]|nr:hypothetical protein [Acidiferrobacterales bacterium]
MKKIINLGRLANLTLFALAAFACADGDNDFQIASQHYCELYNPNTWGELANSGDTYSIYNEIVTRQEKQITNKKLKAIISKADNTGFGRYYQDIQTNISNVLGSEWQCQYFEQFYMPTQKVISLTLNGILDRRIDPSDRNTVIITLVKSGQIIVGNAPLVGTDIKTISAAIQSRVGTKPIDSIDFVLYFDEDGKGDLTPKILSSLTGLGVKRVSLIDF